MLLIIPISRCTYVPMFAPSCQVRPRPQVGPTPRRPEKHSPRPPSFHRRPSTPPPKLTANLGQTRPRPIHAPAQTTGIGSSLGHSRRWSFPTSGDLIDWCGGRGRTVLMAGCGSFRPNAQDPFASPRAKGRVLAAIQGPKPRTGIVPRLLQGRLHFPLEPNVRPTKPP